MATISAVYENGVFKPLDPVSLPEGTRVSVGPESLTTEQAVELTYREFLADGMPPEKAKEITDNLRLLWETWDSLTAEQRQIMEEARLHNTSFFHQTP